VTIAADLRRAANALIAEKTRHGQTARRLQSQLDGFAESDLQLRSDVQALQHTNTALAQEILRLKGTVDTLNGVIRAVCGHSQCHCQ
jgi:FtsZ-binding cell division protein ZapB